MLTALVILAVHFLADFVFQTSAMATGKSKSLKWLSIHVGTYALVSLLSATYLALNYDITLALSWWIVNVVLHFFTDLITSRISSRLWDQKNMRLFFVVIGADQLIHQICLLGTLTLVFFFWH